MLKIHLCSGSPPPNRDSSRDSDVPAKMNKASHNAAGPSSPPPNRTQEPEVGSPESERRGPGQAAADRGLRGETCSSETDNAEPLGGPRAVPLRGVT